MIQTHLVPLIMWALGGFICISAGHPELAGLGLMIVAGCNRIAWGTEDNARKE